MTKFRTDINGLRGLGVLAVLLYHFGVKGFSGGYVGVDVFYVISGFLMTQIILSKASTGRFSLAGFYAARARRILPALAAVAAVLLAAGYFYIPPVDYKLFGWQALSALTFVSNIVLSHQGDYFDTAAREKWLLHTWSLSVEWQFYLLLPLFLLALHRWKRAYLKSGVALLFLLSFVLSAVWTELQPSSAFFLLPTRAWEMLAGSLVFLFAAAKPLSPRIGELGLAFILASIWFYSPDFNFPGLWAALPVTGAALLIAAQPRDGLFDNPVMQFFGTISYSLYLWHWPAIVALRYAGVEEDPLTIALLLMATILLAALSWKFIEEPFRQARRHGPLQLGVYVLAPLFALFVFVNNGLPARVPADVLAVTEKPEGWSVPKRGDCGTDYKKNSHVPACIFGAEAKPTAALWGDSHADALLPALNRSLTETGRAGLLFSNAGCPPVLGAIMPTKLKKYQCRAINQGIFEKIVGDKSIRDVFLTSRWSLYLLGYNEKGGINPYITFSDHVAATDDTQVERARAYEKALHATLCGLTAAGKNVYAIAPVPEMGRDVSAALARARLLYRHDEAITLPLADYRQRNAAVSVALTQAAKTCGVHIIEPAAALCNAASCTGLKGGHPLYSDDNHLNAYGNELIKPLIEKALSGRGDKN